MAQSERRLAAIMFTDIVGYSALTQRDEELSQQLLHEHHRLLRPIFKKYAGAEIKTIGDAFHLEFPSTLQATRAAIDIQEALRDRNESSADERRIKIRIGIHVGDVMPDDEDVYGNTVNIAARIQSEAGGGQIFVSQDVYLQVRNSLRTPLLRLGVGELKNIKDEIEIYRIVLPWEAERMPILERAQFAWQRKRTRYGISFAAFVLILIGAFFLWQSIEPGTGLAFAKDRIAILPFEVIGENVEENEILADGLHEQMISSLARIPSLRVIARNSVMSFKGKHAPIKDIARQLQVGSLLESSIRKAGDKLRITVQLIDTSTEEHIWAEDYDRDYSLSEIFAIQSDVAKQVVDMLHVELLASDSEEIAAKPTENMEAYNLYLQGRFYLNRDTVEGQIQAFELFEKAIEADSNFAPAYIGLYDSAFEGLRDQRLSSQEYADTTREYVTTALELDPLLSDAHRAWGQVKLNYDDDLEGALGSFEQALTLNPNDALAHKNAGTTLANRQLDWDRALDHLRTAAELDPLNTNIRVNIGEIYWEHERDFDAAIAEFESILKQEPNAIVPRRNIAYVNRYQGEWDAAEAQFKKNIELNPDSVNVYLHYFDHLLLLKRFDEAEEQLQKAIDHGLPEEFRHLFRGLLHVAKGNYSLAKSALEDARDKRSNYVDIDMLLAETLALSGQFEDASQIINEMESKYSATLKIPRQSLRLNALRGVIHASNDRQDESLAILKQMEEAWEPLGLTPTFSMRARILVALGDYDGAFELLHKAWDYTDEFIIRIKIDHFFDPIRDDPRFPVLQAKMNLTQ